MYLSGGDEMTYYGYSMVRVEDYDPITKKMTERLLGNSEPFVSKSLATLQTKCRDWSSHIAEVDKSLLKTLYYTIEDESGNVADNRMLMAKGWCKI